MLLVAAPCPRPPRRSSGRAPRPPHRRSPRAPRCLAPLAARPRSLPAAPHREPSRSAPQALRAWNFQHRLGLAPRHKGSAFDNPKRILSENLVGRRPGQCRPRDFQRLRRLGRRAPGDFQLLLVVDLADRRPKLFSVEDFQHLPSFAAHAQRSAPKAAERLVVVDLRDRRRKGFQHLPGLAGLLDLLDRRPKPCWPEDLQHPLGLAPCCKRCALDDSKRLLVVDLIVRRPAWASEDFQHRVLRVHLVDRRLSSTKREDFQHRVRHVRRLGH